jgi:hypothetical protein
MDEDIFPPRKPRRPQSQQDRPPTERVPSIGSAGYNSLSEQMHALKAEIDGWEDGVVEGKEKTKKGGAVSILPKLEASTASKPIPPSASSATHVQAATKATMSQSTPSKGLTVALSFNPTSSSSPLPPKAHRRTSSLGSNPPGSTSSPSSRPPATSSAPPSSTSPREQAAGGAGAASSQDLIDALSSQIDAFGKQVEAFRVERERWKEVVGGSTSSSGNTTAKAKRPKLTNDSKASTAEKDGAQALTRTTAGVVGRTKSEGGSRGGSSNLVMTREASSVVGRAVGEVEREEEREKLLRQDQRLVCIYIPSLWSSG